MHDILEFCRPKDLSEFVATQQTKQILMDLIDDPLRFKNYLLYGNSGIGKTSLARIFKTSHNLTDIDYEEINCADTRGIDYAREILKLLETQPFDKYRVVVLDEAHQLTTQAQNTLLKGLETNPNDTIVLICTTNLFGIIDTIKTRCLKINLNPISFNDKEFLSSINKLNERIKQFVISNNLEIVNHDVSKCLVNTFVPDTFSIREYIYEVYGTLTNSNIERSEGLIDPIELAKSVLKQLKLPVDQRFDPKAWPYAAQKIKSLNCSPETSRIAIINWLNAVLLNQPFDSNLAKIIKSFMVSCSGGDGKAVLTGVFAAMFQKE
jgi:replication-associated recombination protein RarA